MRKETRRLKRKIRQYRNSAVKWALVRGVYIHLHASRYLASSGLSALRRQLRAAIRSENRQRLVTQHPPHLAMWLCVHGREGSWQDNASHNPHWGGLQMSLWFMQQYAPKLLAQRGTANHWTPLQQIWVAEKAYETEHYSRAWLFGQWGQTVPYCV